MTNLDTLEKAQAAPNLFLTQAPAIAVDEAQRLPELFLPLKRTVDQDPRAGRFVLTGSAFLLLLKRVADSLAGWAFYATMHPLNRWELLGRVETPPAVVRFLEEGVCQSWTCRLWMKRKCCEAAFRRWPSVRR